MKHSEKQYQQLLKQATSMMIALRDIAGVLWQADDTLYDIMRSDKDPLEGIREVRQKLMAGIEAMDHVLEAGALEKAMKCGHERRFTMRQERGPSLCTLCELEKAKDSLRMFEEAAERTVEVLSRETEEDRFQREH